MTPNLDSLPRHEEVHVVIRQYRCLTVREVAKEVGICKISCHLILTEKRKMCRVAAKFVPRLLTRRSLSANF
jgi:DNA-directed RNA polymerase specialized sigma24 family protein